MTERITVNAQNSIRIAGEQVVRIDPFRIEDEPHDAALILITHAHFDHFSPEDIGKTATAETVYVLPRSMAEDARRAGLPQARTILLAPGETCTAAGFAVEAAPAYNTNKPMHLKEYGWLGYVVTVDGVRVYVCGDADDMPEGRAVACDVALVPIGGTYTMDAQEAAAFVNAMRPKTVIPTHYGTLVGSPADADVFAQLVDPSIELCRKL